MEEIKRQEVLELAHRARGHIRKIYLHWTAGRYDQLFPGYHLLIRGDGSLVTSTRDWTRTLPHTWNRNTGALGIALCCARDAVLYADGTFDLGDYPPHFPAGGKYIHPAGCSVGCLETPSGACPCHDPCRGCRPGRLRAEHGRDSRFRTVGSVEAERLRWSMAQRRVGAPGQRAVLSVAEAEKGVSLFPVRGQRSTADRCQILRICL